MYVCIKITQTGKMSTLSTTEEKIVEAAREIFAQKGFAGARMQEIADRAGINKGLLHYYFRSKEALFKAIFREAFAQFSQVLLDLLSGDAPVLEKIERIVDIYMDMLCQNPTLPGFIVNELHTNTEQFVAEIMQSPAKPDPSRLIMQLHLEAQTGKIRSVDPFHTVLNILSMCVFPFIARPLIQQMVHLDEPTYMELMRQRKKAVKDFIRTALLPEGQSV